MPLTDIEQVRLNIGDTLPPPDQVFTDAQIQNFLDLAGGNVALATYYAIKAIIAEFILHGESTDQKTGDIETKHSQRLKYWFDLLGQYEDEAGPLATSGIPTVYAGGISKSDMEAAENDTDRVGPNMRRGMFDNPRTADPNNPKRNRNIFDHGY